MIRDIFLIRFPRQKTKSASQNSSQATCVINSPSCQAPRASHHRTKLLLDLPTHHFLVSTAAPKCRNKSRVRSGWDNFTIPEGTEKLCTISMTATIIITNLLTVNVRSFRTGQSLRFRAALLPPTRSPSPCGVA